jgi:hypothetical protein
MSDFSKHKRQDYLKEHKGLVYKYGHDMVVKGIKKNNPNSNSSIPKVVIRKRVPEFDYWQEGMSYYGEWGRIMFKGRYTRDGILEIDSLANFKGDPFGFLSKNNPYNEVKSYLTYDETYKWLNKYRVAIKLYGTDGYSFIKLFYGPNAWRWSNGAFSDNVQVSGIEIVKEEEYDYTNDRRYNTFKIKVEGLEEQWKNMSFSVYLYLDLEQTTTYIEQGQHIGFQNKYNIVTKINGEIVRSRAFNAKTYTPNATIFNSKISYNPQIYLPDGMTIFQDDGSKGYISKKHIFKGGYFNKDGAPIFDANGELFQETNAGINNIPYKLECYRISRNNTNRHRRIVPDYVVQDINEMSYYKQNNLEHAPLYSYGCQQNIIFGTKHHNFDYQSPYSQVPQGNTGFYFLVEKEHKVRGNMEYGYYYGYYYYENSRWSLELDMRFAYKPLVIKHPLKKWRKCISLNGRHHWGKWFRLRLVNNKKHLVSNTSIKFYYSRHNYINNNTTPDYYTLT